MIPSTERFTAAQSGVLRALYDGPADGMTARALTVEGQRTASTTSVLTTLRKRGVVGVGSGRPALYRLTARGRDLFALVAGGDA